MTSDSTVFVGQTAKCQPTLIKFANGTQTVIEQSGMIELVCSTSQGRHVLRIHDVLYVPDDLLVTSLLSVSQLAAAGITTSFSTAGADMHTPNGHSLENTYSYRGLYWLRSDTTARQASQPTASTTARQQKP